MAEIESNYPRKVVPAAPEKRREASFLYTQLVLLQVSAWIYVPLLLVLFNWRHFLTEYFGIYCLTIPTAFAAMVSFLNSDNQDDELTGLGMHLHWQANFILAYWLFVPFVLPFIHLRAFWILRRRKFRVNFFALNRKTIMGQLKEMARQEREMNA